MCKGMCSLFVGVFVGAVVFELARRTEIGKATARKVMEGFQSATRAFGEGYRATVQPSPVEAST